MKTIKYRLISKLDFFGKIASISFCIILLAAPKNANSQVSHKKAYNNHMQAHQPKLIINYGPKYFYRTEFVYRHNQNLYNTEFNFVMAFGGIDYYIHKGKFYRIKNKRFYCLKPYEIPRELL